MVAGELADSGCEAIRAGFLDRIETFAIELALWGSKLNLTAAPDQPAEIAFHVIDSLAPLLLARKASHQVLLEGFASGVRVLDLGSGAGFPGLILGAACDAEFVLVEARRKRASFLSVTAAAMGLANVRVESSRADSTALEPVFDVVTARAFAAPAMAVNAAAMALRAGGRAILYATPAQRPAIEAACAGCFESTAFFGYEVARGAVGVAHALAIARRRQAS
jgi:16S rRNA (guanine527-N7)-methyltransferase